MATTMNDFSLVLSTACDAKADAPMKEEISNSQMHMEDVFSPICEATCTSRMVNASRQNQQDPHAVADPLRIENLMKSQSQEVLINSTAMETPMERETSKSSLAATKGLKLAKISLATPLLSTAQLQKILDNGDGIFVTNVDKVVATIGIAPTCDLLQTLMSELSNLHKEHAYIVVEMSQVQEVLKILQVRNASCFQVSFNLTRSIALCAPSPTDPSGQILLEAMNMQEIPLEALSALSPSPCHLVSLASSNSICTPSLLFLSPLSSLVGQNECCLGRQISLEAKGVCKTTNNTGLHWDDIMTPCQIFVVINSGKTITLNTNNKATVREFKRLADANGTAPISNLIYNGKQLEDSCTLLSYGIGDKCTLWEIVPGVGGTKKVDSISSIERLSLEFPPNPKFLAAIAVSLKIDPHRKKFVQNNGIYVLSKLAQRCVLTKTTAGIATIMTCFMRLAEDETLGELMSNDETLQCLQEIEQFTAQVDITWYLQVMAAIVCVLGNLSATEICKSKMRQNTSLLEVAVELLLRLDPSAQENATLFIINCLDSSILLHNPHMCEKLVLASCINNLTVVDRIYNIIRRAFKDGKSQVVHLFRPELFDIMQSRLISKAPEAIVEPICGVLHEVITNADVTVSSLRENVHPVLQRLATHADKRFRVIAEILTSKYNARFEEQQGMIKCYNMPCLKRGTFNACGACKGARYCSEECQKADWKAGHKLRCAEIREHGEQYRSLPLYLNTVAEAKFLQTYCSEIARQAAAKGCGISNVVAVASFSGGGPHGIRVYPIPEFYDKIKEIVPFIKHDLLLWIRNRHREQSQSFPNMFIFVLTIPGCSTVNLAWGTL